MKTIQQIPFAVLGTGAAFTVLWGVADPVAAFAEVKVVEADDYYIVGDGPDETMAVAKEYTKARARRAASEKAGVFVAALSEVKMGKLTRDEVRTISSTVLEVLDVSVTPVPVQVETDSGSFSVLRLHCHMVAKVDTENVMEQLRMDIIKREAAVKKNQVLEKEFDAIDANVVRIKEEYKTADASGKERLNQEMKANERRFEAMERCRKGDSYSLFEEGGDKEAVVCYNKALEIDPTYANAWVCLGLIYHVTLTESDEKYFRKAVELEPENALYWDYLGDSLLVFAGSRGTSENFEECVACYEKATKLDPGNPDYWLHLGRAYKTWSWKAVRESLSFLENDSQKRQLMELCNKAIACYNKAIECNPGVAHFWYELGDIYRLRLDQEDKAEECYQRADEIKRVSGAGQKG